MMYPLTNIKKLFFIFSFFLISFDSFSNPIWGPPFYYIGKFSIINNQNWNINVYLSIGNDTPDSVLVCSSSGSSIFKKFKLDTLKHGYYINYGSGIYDSIFYYVYVPFFIINNDSLNSKININPEGDSITLIYYSKNIPLVENRTETIVFGNYRNATIPKPRNGQSIVTFLTYDQLVPQEVFHCLADSAGYAQGTIHGHIYNSENLLLSKGTFAISPFYGWDDYWSTYNLADTFMVNSDGTYSTKLYALNYHFGIINICSGYIVEESSRIDSLNFTIEPDTAINLDIHLTGDYFHNDINYIDNNYQIIKIFPNPVNGNIIQYEISTPVISTNCYIDLININGQEINRYSITDNNGELQLPTNISNGTYLLQLQMNGKVYSTTRIIVLK